MKKITILSLLFLFGFVIVCVGIAAGQAYHFSSSTEGWTLQGAFKNCNNPCEGCTAYSHSCSLSWYDASPWSGVLRMSVPSAPSVTGTSSDFWIMRLASPDLSANSSWQHTVGLTVQLYRALGPGQVWGSLFLEIFDNDQQRCRSWYSNAQVLTSNSWTQLSLDWWNDTNFPTNYVIKRIYVLIWGQVTYSYSGYVYLDQVIGTPDTTSPLLTITAPTSNPTYSTSASSVNLGGTASDNTRVALVTWTNNRGGSGTCSGTTSWSASGIALYSGANVITVTARDGAQNVSTDTLTVTYTPETVSTPSTPSGSMTGTAGVTYTYTTGGSISSLGHPVQYWFDWQDGTGSGWGSTSASHTWSSPGTYNIKVQARCSTNTGILSSWSGTLPVTISPLPTCTYTLSVSTNPSSGGTVTKNPQKSTYCFGDVVTLTATPNPGYTFSSWSGDATGSANPITLTMNSNKNVTANFTATPTCTYTLSVSTNPSSGGTVTKYPQKSTYCFGELVTLTATPNPGYTFSSWSGVDSSNGSTATVTMNGNRTVTANFGVGTSCASISPKSTNHGFGAETGSVSVAVITGSGCSWNATSSASWITITSGRSGTGSGTVTYSVSANPDSRPRTGTMTIAGQTFTVTQARLLKEGLSEIILPPVSSNWGISGFYLASPSEGWAVGDDPQRSTGVLLHYNVWCKGNCMTMVTPPPVSPDWYLTGVYFHSSNEGWAVGRDETNKRGVLLHYLNGSWSSASVPTVSSDWELYAVHFTSENEGWAVGYDKASTRGLILYYLDGLWSAVLDEGKSGEAGGSSPLPSGSVTYHLYLLSPDEGWAVGGAANKGLILHYLNGSWINVDSPSVSSGWYLSWIHFTSLKEGWAVGTDHVNRRGVLLHYLNGSWSSVVPPSVSPDWELRNIHFSSSSQGWAVGRDIANHKALLLRYSNGTWKAMARDVNLNSEMTGVKCICSEAWATGSDLTSQAGVALEYTSGASGVDDYRDASSGAKPNLIPYKPKGWADKIVVSSEKGTNKDKTPLYSIDPLYVDLAVLNDSNWIGASPFRVDLHVDGVLKNSWSWDGLGHCTYGYMKDYLIGSLSAGTHTIKVTVDATGGVDESHEGDNEYEKTITVVGSSKPNLVFTHPTGWSDKMRVSKKRMVEYSHPLTIKDTLYVSWSVQNNGGVKTPGKAKVSLYVDGVKKKSWQNMKSMVPSSTWVKTGQSIGKLSKGEREIRLVVEGEGLALGDNEVVKLINIQGQAGDVDRPTLEGSTCSSPGQNLPYRVGGSVCRKGGEVEYFIDWGDGTEEDWFSPEGQRNHDWSEGYWQVSVKARCKDYWDVQSEVVRQDVYVFGSSVSGAD